MSAEFQSDQDRLIAELRATIAEQQEELDSLHADSAGVMASRRALLRGAGVVGGIAALAGVGSVAAKPQAAQAIEGHNVKYAPNTFDVAAKVVGSKQGAIAGGMTQKGLEGFIDVTYFQQKVTSPRDAASGLATGRRQYNPIVVRKHVDKASPKLELALINNEVLSSVQFRFFKSFADGTIAEFYRVDLTNAFLGSLDLYSPEAVAGSGTGAAPGLLEELTLTFQSITWTYLDGGITAQDDWQQQA
ncbi:MAG: type VI secretion system tube protein TssD [Mycobacteriales bacterium]